MLVSSQEELPSEIASTELSFIISCSEMFKFSSLKVSDML